jgi:hypothetical protein
MRNLMLVLVSLLLFSCSIDGDSSSSEANANLDIQNSYSNQKQDSIDSSKGLKMSLINGQQLHGVTKFLSGKLIKANDDVGVPNGHTFTVLSSDGNEMSFRFIDEGDSTLLSNYVGLACTVDFIPVVQQSAVAIIGETDSLIYEEFADLYFKYQFVIGKFVAPVNPSTKYPSDYSVIDSDGIELNLVGLISDEELKYDGLDVKLHYNQEIKNFAMSINFEVK